MKKHYETHVEDTDKLISVAGPVLDYKSWYEQYRKLMEEQAQRKYGLYTPTSEGDDDDFPSITGMIARYSALGLTNEQMAANPVWVDKTGNGHDIQLKNFSWKGMSGVGGYGDENYQTFYKFTLDDYVFIASPPGVKHMNFTFRVTGLQPGNKLTLAFFGTTNTVYGTWDKDGIYTVNSAVVEVGKPVYFYNGYGATRGEFTIEILPLYPGALVFDGVDDYGICENFPILTKEKGYTVVALRQWIEEKNDSTALVSNCKNWNQDGAFLFEYNNLRINVLNESISFGHVSIVDREKSPFSYQTSKLYNGKNIEPGSFIGSNELVVGKGSKGFSTVSKVAIWEIVILDHDATEEELTKIKNYFIKTYPWLFFDQAWTVVGKSNEDADRATIANITGNGNNLVLSNFGFAGNSGYGEYAQNFNIDKWTIATPSRVEATKTNSSFNITEVKGTAIQLYYLSTQKEVAFTILSTKVRVTGLTDGQTINYRYFVDDVANDFLIPSDGIYNLPEFEFPAKGDYYGFNLTKVQSSCNITIEQIPNHEGYLVTDGVDDIVASSSFELDKKFTVVGEWKFINNESKRAGIVFPSKLYAYNEKENMLVYINTSITGNTLQNIRSFKALTSDGKLYDNNWEERVLKAGDMGLIRNTITFGGFIQNGVFTQIALKNLGIYNNQTLSKEDCIKAYNYLQTLKAK
nr:MAG TPA: hypothetical protein [Caudoviricetes sp.]